MANSSTFASIVWLFLLAGLAYAGYRYYDHAFISPGLRESLTAAVDPANTQSDILADLRNAQTQIHTSRDAEVESMLQRAVLLTQSAAAASQHNGDTPLTAIWTATSPSRGSTGAEASRFRRASRTPSNRQPGSRRKRNKSPTQLCSSINRPPSRTPPRRPSCSSSSAPLSAFPPARQITPAVVIPVAVQPL